MSASRLGRSSDTQRQPSKERRVAIPQTVKPPAFGDPSTFCPALAADESFHLSCEAQHLLDGLHTHIYSSQEKGSYCLWHPLTFRVALNKIFKKLFVFLGIFVRFGADILVLSPLAPMPAGMGSSPLQPCKAVIDNG